MTFCVTVLRCVFGLRFFKKEYTKYFGWLVLLVYLAVYRIAGAIPY